MHVLLLVHFITGVSAMLKYPKQVTRPARIPKSIQVKLTSSLLIVLYLKNTSKRRTLETLCKVNELHGVSKLYFLSETKLQLRCPQHKTQTIGMSIIFGLFLTYMLMINRYKNCWQRKVYSVTQRISVMVDKIQLCLEHSQK